MEERKGLAGRWLIIIFLLALLLRLVNLGGKSLWVDEGFSVTQAMRATTAVFTNVDDSHPPLYYMMLHYWVARFGSSEAAVRLPSVLVSLANLGLLYLLTRSLFNRQVAITAAALLAVAPLDIWYAQEARMYLFITFAGLLIAVGLAWQHELGSLLVVAGLTFGLYIDYLVAPLWVAISAIWLVLWWQRGRAVSYFFFWLMASLVGWWLYRPWWPVFRLFLTGEAASRFALERLRLALGLPELALGHLLVALAVAAVGLMVGVVVLQKVVQQPRYGRWLAFAIISLFVVLTILSPLPRLYGGKRLLVVIWPYAILLVAWFIQDLSQKLKETNGVEGKQDFLWHRLVAVSLVASLITIFLVPKDDWRGVAAYLQQEAAGESLVWLDPVWNRPVYLYYRPDDPVGPNERRTLPEAAEASSDIWLAAERFPGVEPPASAGEAWLDEHWQLVEAVPFYRLELRHYEKGEN